MKARGVAQPGSAPALGAGGRGFESRRPDVVFDPEIRYAKSGDLNIAYEVIGDAERDLMFIPGYVSHLDLFNQIPFIRAGFERASRFARVITFDKRGSGLSDPVAGAPTLEDRMEDMKAVLDAAGSEKTALFAISEGGPTALLFAATYPERVSAIVLYGAMARSTWAPDYEIAAPAEDLLEGGALLLEYWGQGVNVEVFSPSVADDPAARAQWAKLERQASSPAQVLPLFLMFLEVDVRNILPSIHVPTLVLHRRGDRVVNVRHGRYLAEHIPGAKIVEFPGIDHTLTSGEDPTPIFDEIETFLTGVRPKTEPDRMLATVMFTDVVGSTEKAAALGDQKWRTLLEDQQRVVRKHLERFDGREIKTMGDGFLATFDGPARAIKCGHAVANDVRSLGIELRVGLHAGEVEVLGDDIGGIAVHIASRVGHLAGANEVLVSETVKGLVAGSGITFEERGEHELKGVPDTWRLFAATPPASP